MEKSNMGYLDMCCFKKKAKRKNVRILGIPFTRYNFEEILDLMAIKIELQQQGHYIAITNTESSYHATYQQKHYHYIDKAAFSCCDGIGLVLAARILNARIPRLHGPDLVLKCCEYGVKKQWRHYFYGGKEGVPELLSENLKRQFPGLKIAGVFSPPFRPVNDIEDLEVIRKINNTKPDIVWVGLGLLKQERWISEHLNKINAAWMIGVGAAFDFHAGTIKRAPKCYRKIGLEWLYRVAFEPRMIKRNLLSLKFFLMVLIGVLKNKQTIIKE